MPETVVKDGNVDRVDRVRNRVDWKGRSMMECDGKAGDGAGIMSEHQEWT